MEQQRDGPSSQEQHMDLESINPLLLQVKPSKTVAFTDAATALKEQGINVRLHMQHMCCQEHCLVKYIVAIMLKILHLCFICRLSACLWGNPTSTPQPQSNRQVLKRFKLEKLAIQQMQAPWPCGQRYAGS